MKHYKLMDISGPWLRVLSSLLFLAAWQFFATYSNSDFLPSPNQVLINFVDHMIQGDLPFQLGITLMRVVVSFFTAMAIGVAVGLIMGRYQRWDASLDGVLILALNLPALVVIILCYIWFGLGEFAAILAVSINKFPLVVVNVREGARAVNQELLEVGSVFRVPSKRLFLKIFLPQLYPYLLASARAGLALIWKIVLIVELLGRSNGVGFKLGIFFQFFDITSILSYSFAFIGIVMIIEYLLIAPIDRRLSEWRK